MNNKKIEKIFGKENLEMFSKQREVLKKQEDVLSEIDTLNMELKDVFKVDLTLPDIIASVSSGVIIGLFDALFKQYIPKSGEFKHEHSTTRTGVDYKVPKPQGFKGSPQNLHRQVGPGHDVFRFKDALDLMSGNKNDFKLWGGNISKFMENDLHSGNMKIADFIARGGFKIPQNPKAELINHLLIDFFTKMSLPIPFTTYIADYNQECAVLMLNMYDNGFNLKNFVGGTTSTVLLELLLRGYVMLFKAIPNGIEVFKTKDECKFVSGFDTICKKNKEYLSSNECNMLGILSHGSSFLIDSLITTSSKSYAGIFQLNFGSLLMFSKYVISYTMKCLKEKREIEENLVEAKASLEQFEIQWQQGFKDNVLKIVKKDGFLDTFDFEKISNKEKQIRAMQTDISDNIKERKKLFEELEGIDI